VPARRSSAANCSRPAALSRSPAERRRRTRTWPRPILPTPTAATTIQQTTAVTGQVLRSPRQAAAASTAGAGEGWGPRTDDATRIRVEAASVVRIGATGAPMLMADSWKVGLLESLTPARSTVAGCDTRSVQRPPRGARSLATCTLVVTSAPRIAIFHRRSSHLCSSANHREASAAAPSRNVLCTAYVISHPRTVGAAASRYAMITTAFL
jgi:hypothetical protein